MADLLRRGLAEVPGLEILYPGQANAVFVRFPPGAAEALRARGWIFYDFIAAAGSRLMCSWDTEEQDVRAFLEDLRQVMGSR
jgi:threonine aldolase